MQNIIFKIHMFLFQLLRDKETQTEADQEPDYNLDDRFSDMEEDPSEGKGDRDETEENAAREGGRNEENAVRGGREGEDGQEEERTGASQFRFILIYFRFIKNGTIHVHLHLHLNQNAAIIIIYIHI